MMAKYVNPPAAEDGDSRPRSADELLCALHAKFSANFDAARGSMEAVAQTEWRARKLAAAGDFLKRAATEPHQQEAATYLDEIFGDVVCALYLTCCGLTVPARMLLRRSLELGLVVAVYWDSPVEFWDWREHDGDISFSELARRLQAPAYATHLQKLNVGPALDPSVALKDIAALYHDLSNVVHPKPYNFATVGAGAYAFSDKELEKSVEYAARVTGCISSLLVNRFRTLENLFEANV